MEYEIYKNSRNASWEFLIKNNIRSLPVDLKAIVSDMDIFVRRDINGLLAENERGITLVNKDRTIIIVREASVPQTRYTIAHEIGHIVLGHYEYSNITHSEEYAAERFAIGILAPACVLWGLDIHKAEEIADLCNISITSARIREKTYAGVIYSK